MSNRSYDAEHSDDDLEQQALSDGQAELHRPSDIEHQNPRPSPLPALVSGSREVSGVPNSVPLFRRQRRQLDDYTVSKKTRLRRQRTHLGRLDSRRMEHAARKSSAMCPEHARRRRRLTAYPASSPLAPYSGLKKPSPHCDERRRAPIPTEPGARDG